MSGEKKSNCNRILMSKASKLFG